MTFNNILFPVDFSDSSFTLKADVEWIAKKFNSTVTLMHVFEVPPAWYGMGDAYAVNADWLAEVMEEAKKRLDAFNLDLPANKINRIILEGQPAPEIQDWCRNHSVDLVVMATHGHGAFEGLMMGSVTAKVLHNLNLPLWLSPANPTNAVRDGKFHIVCGLDLGEETLPVLIYAKQMAEAFNATVTLVHSVPEAENRPNKYLDFDLHNILKGIAKKEITTYQKQAITEFELVIMDSPISTALADTAAGMRADMILIGRGHCQKFLGRFRTHTYDLLSRVGCPVFSYCPEYHAAETVGAVAPARLGVIQTV